MSWIHVFWDLGPGGNAEHVADHGLELEEVEHVLKNPEKDDVSRSSKRPVIFGHTRAGEYIMVVYEELDNFTVYPVSAYPVEE